MKMTLWHYNNVDLLHHIWCIIFQACEVVRPLIQLLGIDRTAIQNFEALMALTNLAAMSDTVRYIHVNIVNTATFEPLVIVLVKTSDTISIHLNRRVSYFYRLQLMKFSIS